MNLLLDFSLKTASLLKSGGKVIFAGNGGSFSDAQHISAEFTSKLNQDRDPIPSIVLGANSSSISAIGNDYGYQYVFSRELSALTKPNDIFIPLSTSGDSPNILHAADVALKNNILVMGLTGESGGSLSSICSCIKIPSTNTAYIQESHIMIGHIYCSLVERALIGVS